MRHYNLIKAEQCRLGVLMIQTPLGLNPARIPSCSLLSLATWTRFARGGQNRSRASPAAARPLLVGVGIDRLPGAEVAWPL